MLQRQHINILSSGKIGFIENEILKKGLLAYYQKTTPNIVLADNLYNTFLFKALDIKIANAGKSGKEIYLDPKFQAALYYILKLGENNIGVYDDIGIKQARELIAEIDKELKE